ncbi:MAG: thioredoxin domain-containing protein [Gammaproteobacteria bacterium]|nr:thioredoxin domain-containing protein [Gammaproteobacteria bacterium]
MFDAHLSCGRKRQSEIHQSPAPTSPRRYLVQHAHNPVDWYPWGREAFETARAEDKPVFLSIGYSTCHWCHVMEAECFDNEDIAAYLNKHFVSIKLDREQRPDLDDVYMTGVQMLTGQGGWPMSNFLNPEGEPFFAGTYFPPQNFRSLLEQIATVWRERREDVDKQAQEIAQNIKRFTSAKAEAIATWRAARVDHVR